MWTKVSEKKLARNKTIDIEVGVEKKIAFYKWFIQSKHAPVQWVSVQQFLSVQQNPRHPETSTGQYMKIPNFETTSEHAGLNYTKINQITPCILNTISTQFHGTNR